MALTIQQRLDRLQGAASRSCNYWRAREGVTVDGWTLDGKPIALGGAWPSREGVHKFAATAEVPAHWPLEETRLLLDLGGESLVTLSYPNRDAVSFGLDPYHREFPLQAPAGRDRAESTARDPFGEPVRAPRLNRAVLQWIDAAGASPAPAAEAGRRGRARRSAATRSCRICSTPPRAAQRSLDWPSDTAGLHRPHGALAAASSRSGSCRRADRADPPALDQAQRASVVAAYDALIDDAQGAAAALSAAGRAAAHRPRPYRSRLALALRRDAPQDAPHLPHRAEPDGSVATISASTSRPRTTTRRSKRTIRRCSTAIKARVAVRPVGNHRRHVGRARHQHADRRDRWRARSSTASAISRRISASATPSAGCPTASASPARCRSS